MRVTLTQLSYAVALDTHRHYVNAALACRVTQPALSAQIKKLEAALGVALFDRSQKPVKPTPVGVKILQQARAVLREADRLQGVVEDAENRLSRRYTLGVMPSLGMEVVAKLTAAVEAALPEVNLLVEEHNEPDLLKGVESGSLDAALLAGASTHEDLAVYDLFTEEIVAYVAPTHRLHATEAIALNQLTLAEVSRYTAGYDYAVQLFNEHELPEPPPAQPPARQVSFSTRNLAGLLQAVCTYQGITLLPALCIPATNEHQGNIRPIGPHGCFRQVQLVRQQSSFRQAVFESVLAAMRRVAPASVPVPSKAVSIRLPKNSQDAIAAGLSC